MSRDQDSPRLEIGDAVVPRNEPDHDVMTVYDLTDNFTVAHCNWVVGTKMDRRTLLVKHLRQVRRTVRHQRGGRG